MGQRSDGRWLASQIGLSTPRQNGKSQLVVARALAGILAFDEQLIMVSAHQQDTAREVFTRLVDILEAYPSLNDRVETYGKALNREYIKFKSGQVIRFKARSKGGGRGFSCDCLLLDEAQILDAPSWAAILPTMSARPNPQVWLLGTPPTPLDDGEVFTRVRRAALDGASKVAWLEWSADERDDITSPETWAKANPAFGTRIQQDAIEGEFEVMSPEQFQLERLGMWASAIMRPPVIASNLWEPLKVDAAPEGRPAYGVRFSPDGAVGAVSVAVPADGKVHVELVDVGPTTTGIGGIVDWCVERKDNAITFVIDGKSHRDLLVEQLIARGVKKSQLLIPSVDQVIAAHSMFLDAVQTETLTHYNQPELNASVAHAGKRIISKVSGGWGFAPLGTGSVTEVESATLAHYGAVTQAGKKQRTGKSVFR